MTISAHFESALLADRCLKNWKGLVREDDDASLAKKCYVANPLSAVQVEHARKNAGAIENIFLYVYEPSEGFIGETWVSEAAVKNFHAEVLLRATETKIGEWVKMPACLLLKEELAACEGGSDASPQEVAEKIEQSFRYILNSVAKGILDSGLNTFELAVNGRFTEAIARAVLFRLPVGFYNERDFVIDLYNDFSEAVKQGKIRHSWWSVKSEAGGGLTLLVDVNAAQSKKNEGEGAWKKARAVRFSELAQK